MKRIEIKLSGVHFEYKRVSAQFWEKFSNIKPSGRALVGDYKGFTGMLRKRSFTLQGDIVPQSSKKLNRSYQDTVVALADLESQLGMELKNAKVTALSFVGTLALKSEVENYLKLLDIKEAEELECINGRKFFSNKGDCIFFSRSIALGDRAGNFTNNLAVEVGFPAGINRKLKTKKLVFGELYSSSTYNSILKAWYSAIANHIFFNNDDWSFRSVPELRRTLMLIGLRELGGRDNFLRSVKSVMESDKRLHGRLDRYLDRITQKQQLRETLSKELSSKIWSIFQQLQY